MSFVYSGVDSLKGQSKVGSGQCAVLIQYYTKAGLTKHGKLVKKSLVIRVFRKVRQLPLLLMVNIQLQEGMQLFIYGRMPIMFM